MPQTKKPAKFSKFNKLSKPIKIVSLVLFALVFYFAGFLVGHRNVIFEKTFQPKVINMELAKPATIDFGIFWKAWNLVLQNSVDSPDIQKMVYGAIDGMVQSLNDPYSIFMDPSTSQDFAQQLSGSLEGIGAEISTKDNKIIVVTPLSGSPAELAGIKPNDQIIKINDTDTLNMAVDVAVGLIRGPAGTKVKLAIMRDSLTSPVVIEIKRDKITIKSVIWSMKTDTVGYIKVSQFGDDTTSLMQQGAKELATHNPQAIILDLRHNPGGYLQSAVDMVGLFTDPGTVVVKEKNKGGQIQVEKTIDVPILPKVKMIVLIDEGSASAAEIVAGALQDLGRAQLVGAKSFGKGSVQELEDLGNGATLKLTIAEWLTSKDRAINHVGIEPDLNIGLSEDDAKAGRDPQLDKAMELAK